MRLSEIRKNVLIVEFDTRYLCAATMMRIQEFYESPFKNIRGKFFTVEEYMDTYAAAKGKFTYRDEDYVYKGEKNFTYFMDWEAFNIPGHIVKEFCTLFCNKLTEKESKLLGELVPYTLSKEKFYLIAVVKGEKYITHELAHAYYYLYPDYKLAMDNEMTDLGRLSVIRQCILSTSSGYSEGVVLDEIQAYLSTGTIKNINEDIGFKVRQSELDSFSRVFKQFDRKKR